MSGLELRIGRRAADHLQRSLEADRAAWKSAPARFDLLMEQSAEGRLETIRADPRYQEPALGRFVLERADLLLETAAREALALLPLVHAIGERRSGDRRVPCEIEALLGRARSLEGEARRRQGRLAAARAAFAEARRHLEAEPSASPEREELCGYLGRLRRDQGRDDEAVALLELAWRRSSLLGGRGREEEWRLDLAWMHLEDFETEEALALLDLPGALAAEPEVSLAPEEVETWGSLIEPFASDPRRLQPWRTLARERRLRRWLSGRHALVLVYADLGRGAAARALLEELKQEALELRVDPLRLQVVEASALDRLGAPEEAAERLLAAGSGYALAGEPYEAALAFLALAGLWAEQGAARDLQRLRGTLAELPGLPAGVREPVLSGLDLALRAGLAAVERLEALKVFVGRARHDPEARFALAGEDGEEESSSTPRPAGLPAAGRPGEVA